MAERQLMTFFSAVIAAARPTAVAAAAVAATTAGTAATPTMVAVGVAANLTGRSCQLGNVLRRERDLIEPLLGHVEDGVELILPANKEIRVLLEPVLLKEVKDIVGHLGFFVFLQLRQLLGLCIELRLRLLEAARLLSK